MQNLFMPGTYLKSAIPQTAVSVAVPVAAPMTLTQLAQSFSPVQLTPQQRAVYAAREAEQKYWADLALINQSYKNLPIERAVHPDDEEFIAAAGLDKLTLADSFRSLKSFSVYGRDLAVANAPIWQKTLAKWNAGLPTTFYFEPLFAQLNQYFNPPIPRGQMTQATVVNAYSQWVKDAEMGGAMKVAQGVAIVGAVVLAVAAAVAVGTAVVGGSGAGAAGGTAAATTTTEGIVVAGIDTGITTGVAAVDTVIGSAVTGAATGGAQNLISGGSATAGAQAGAQAGAVSGTVGELKIAANNLDVQVPDVNLPKLDLNVPRYDIAVPKLDLQIPRLNVQAPSVPVQNQGGMLAVPVPPGMATQEVPQNNIDWEKIAKVALPVISIGLLILGR